MRGLARAERAGPMPPRMATSCGECEQAGQGRPVQLSLKSVVWAYFREQSTAMVTPGAKLIHVPSLRRFPLAHATPKTKGPA